MGTALLSCPAGTNNLDPSSPDGSFFADLAPYLVCCAELSALRDLAVALAFAWFVGLCCKLWQSTVAMLRPAFAAAGGFLQLSTAFLHALIAALCCSKSHDCLSRCVCLDCSLIGALHLQTELQPLTGCTRVSLAGTGSAGMQIQATLL